MTNQTMRKPSSFTMLLMWATLSVHLVACNRSSPRPESDGTARPSGSVEGRATDGTAAEAHDINRILAVLPDFELTDQRGNAYTSRHLYTKIWIANFVFTRCGATCPAQTAKMTELQQQLERHSEWDNIRLVSFTVDPEFDTPSVLQQYANNASADDEHWKFLTGSRDTIWELSKNGFKLPVGADDNAAMPIFHSPRFVLVDRYLRVRGFYEVLNADGLRQLRSDLDKVLRQQFP